MLTILLGYNKVSRKRHKNFSDLTLGLFAKNIFFDILEIFRLDVDQLAPIYSKRHEFCNMKASFPFH